MKKEIRPGIHNGPKALINGPQLPFSLSENLPRLNFADYVFGNCIIL